MKNMYQRYKGFGLYTNIHADEDTALLGAFSVTFWRVRDTEHSYQTSRVTTGKEARRLARLTINSLAMLPLLVASRARFAEGGGSE